MSKTIIQIQVEKSLRDKAAKQALSMGFSSLQESLRLVLNKIASGKLRVTWDADEEELSPRAARRYDTMVRDIESGKIPAYQAKNVDDLMDYLHGRKHLIRKKLS